MRISARDTALSRLFLLGPAAISILVITNSVTDPVNSTKLFLLGGVAFAGLATLTKTNFHFLWAESKGVIVASTLFLFAMLNSLANSDAPLAQQIYGVYGRNNGFVLYFALLSLLIISLSIKSQHTVSKLLGSLALTGLVNLVYCAWVIAFGDFIGWSNPYGNILGTFGNPNFIGAFLGIFSAATLSFAILQMKNIKILLPTILVYALTLIEIVNSNAIQGRVLFVLGVLINGFYFLRSRVRTWLLPNIYLAFTGGIGLLGVLGTLQIGPLVGLLYKESVSLRGEYWYAGFKMGVTHLWTGVGFDTYGDWFRTLRRSSALVRPGIDTVSNSAHNVFLDIFAFGGLPLVATYIGILSFVVLSIFKFTKRHSDFDFRFVALVGAWACFQLQSLISINQVGLAIWGWLLSGAIIAYERITSDQATISKDQSLQGKPKKASNPEIISFQLRGGIGFVLGLLIAVPPLSADMKWRSAQMSGNAQQVESVLNGSYMNPLNSYKYLEIVGAFEQSNLPETARKLALEAVKFNPHNYESWRLFTLISGVSQQEMQTALSKMHELDPLNPNIVEAN
ncbi:hypothetical protein MCEMRE254_00051 [Candidatus Nanopelagicaceae bacterium]